MSGKLEVCVSNIAQHGTGETLRHLHERGFEIRLASCLSLCAGCKRQPICLGEGGIADPHDVLMGTDRMDS